MGKAKNICGGRVRRLRLALGLTTEEFSSCLRSSGVFLSPEQVVAIEDRERRVRDFEVVALAKALRTTVTALLGRGGR